MLQSAKKSMNVLMELTCAGIVVRIHLEAINAIADKDITNTTISVLLFVLISSVLATYFMSPLTHLILSLK